MTENPSHELATPEEWSRARHRETILRSPVTQSSLSEADIRLASKRMGVGRAYFYRLLAAYRLRPQTSTLLPRASGRPSGLHLLPARTESLIHKLILHIYVGHSELCFTGILLYVLMTTETNVGHHCREVPIPSCKSGNQHRPLLNWPTF